MRVSIGVIAHNEEKNIRQILEDLLNQKLLEAAISEIVVVSGGSTDKTDRIVEKYRRKYPLLDLIVEPYRRGKAAAVNSFMERATEDLLVLTSADLKLEKDTIARLISPLADPEVGITGVHPLPLNDRNHPIGFAAHLLWNLHHTISLDRPKMGEMIAFRKSFTKIPELSAVDEVNIESLIRGQGYRAVYVPEAVVYNKGPQNLHEFISVRRRIHAGHLATKKEYSYEVSTISILSAIRALAKNIEAHPRFFFYAPLAAVLELYSRLLGFLDYRFKLKDHTVWEIAESTKELE